MPYNFMTRLILHMNGCTDDLSKGECYENGKYIEQDSAAAILCYQKAAQNGSVSAYTKLGNLYLQRNDNAQASYNFWMGAMLGSQESKLALGTLAFQRNITANYYMGRVYEQEQNWVKARECYQVAIDGNDASAMYRLGRLYRQDRFLRESQQPTIISHQSRGLSWYKKAAVFGSKDALEELKEASYSEVEAALYLAEIYISGANNMANDISLAIGYYKRASLLGSAEADFQLGLIYETPYKNETTPNCEENTNVTAENNKSQKMECEDDPNNNDAEVFKNEESIQFLHHENLARASIYYLRAAKKNHNKALINLQRIAEQGKNSKLIYGIALIYDRRKDKINALQWFKKAADLGNKKASDLLKRKAFKDPQFAYEVGEAYEKDSSDIKQTCFYYMLAMIHNYHEAEQRLFLLAEKGGTEAQFIIAYHFYHRKNDFSKAVHWCMKAAESNHQKALDYLNNTPFSAELYLFIAEQYENANGVNKNMMQAMEFYRRANQAGNGNASFRLGQLYEDGDICIQKDFSQAFDHYLLAAEREHPYALPRIEAMLEKLPNKEMEYKLGIFYEQFLKNNSSALCWYKKSSDKGSQEAAERLQVIANSNAGFAYEIGFAYEKDMTCLNHLSMAIFYYTFTLQTKHAEAINRMHALAEEGNSEAQYILGAHYYSSEKDFLLATYWCMQAAESNHPEAQSYLKNTPFSAELCFVIAERYEKGDSVLKNIPQAVEFYHRASEVGDSNAAFRLAQFFEIGNEYIEQDVRKAFEFYMLAAHRKHEFAITNLESILENRSDKEMEYELGVYYEQFLKNNSSALHWYKKSADKGSQEASQRLREIADKDADFAYEAGGAYENDIVYPHQLFQAVSYYAIAVQKKHQEAIHKMHSLANEGNAEAQYILGTSYYPLENDMVQAIHWCMQAVEQKHEKALYYLRATYFSPEIYIIIAQRYEQGSEVLRNMFLAIEFYTKASDSGRNEASFHLGMLYETGIEGSIPDIETAYHYYTIAFKNGHPLALKSLEKIVTAQQNPLWEYELGIFYEQELTNKQEALAWYKKASDGGEKKAADQLERLSISDPDFAYAVALAYDQDEEKEESRILALVYYAIAMRQGHREAEEQLNFAAEVGETNAQYALGYYCYHFKKDFDQAVYWCMQATEQGHIEAWQYLKETSFSLELCLFIAEKYAHGGDNITPNRERAIEFYAKARAIGNKKIDLQLGWLYESEEFDTKRDVDKACNCYLKAIRNGFQEALVPLERLAIEASSDIQIELGDLYLSTFANPIAAMKWYKLAKEVGNFRAQDKLDSFTHPESNELSTYFFTTTNIRRPKMQFGSAVRVENMSTSNNNNNNSSVKFSLGISHVGIDFRNLQSAVEEEKLKNISLMK